MFSGCHVTRFLEWHDVVSGSQSVVLPISNVVHPHRGEKNINLRGTLEWKPSADFTLNLKANYVGHNNNGEVRHTQVFCGPNGVADNLFVLGGAVVIPAGYDCNSFDNVFWLPDSAVPLGRKAPPGMDNNGGVPFNDTDTFLIRAKADIALRDNLSLTLERKSTR